MKVLEIGPSETRARGGMSEVIRGIRESEILGRAFEVDSFPSCIDGSLPARLLYTVYGYLRFLGCYRNTTCSTSWTLPGFRGRFRTRRSGGTPF